MLARRRKALADARGGAYRGETAVQTVGAPVIGAHVTANLRFWTGLLAVFSAALFLLLHSNALGMAGLRGDLLVLSAMILGVLIMMISHAGHAAPEDRGRRPDRGLNASGLPDSAAPGE